MRKKEQENRLDPLAHQYDREDVHENVSADALLSQTAVLALHRATATSLHWFVSEMKRITDVNYLFLVFLEQGRLRDYEL